MKYTKFQKIISYILLTAFFLNISINIPPIFSLVLAKESTFYNLVSIIVDEKTYPEIKSYLDRYARDISSHIENTRVVILPVTENASPFQIASMNEGLYFDGYKSLDSVDFESKLSSTVFVWNIPLPVVYKWENFTKTALPYVDFENKSYIFNREKNRYEENSEGSAEVKAEVEFGFISPNTWNFSEDIKSLKDYFDKNHDFYTEKWFYDKKNPLFTESQPYVFYYDYFREKSWFNDSIYPLYFATRHKNTELLFGRYTKGLLKYFENAAKWEATQEIKSLVKNIDPKFDFSSLEKIDPTKNIYDIQTRIPIEKLKRTFLNVFSKWVLWDIRKNVFNAWRYNFGQAVNVDFIPHIISKLDIFADEFLKNETLKVESNIDEFIDKISRKIALPVSYRIIEKDWSEKVYKNFLHWNDASIITKAEQCSIFRGSTQFTEANRWLDIWLIEWDVKRLWDKAADEKNYNWLWWKNTPLYLDENFSSGELKLKPGYDYNWAIENIFDIKWVKVKDKQDKYADLNPLQCLDNNYLLSKEIREVCDSRDKCRKETVFELKWRNWDVDSINNAPGKFLDFKYNYIENDIKKFSDPRNNTTCDVSIYLDDKIVRKLVNEDFYNRQRSLPEDEREKNCQVEAKYKSLDSVIKHKSPLSSDITAQAEKMITPNLPIDDPRYIDFIRTDWKYIRFNYPNYVNLTGRTLPIAELNIASTNTERLIKINEILKLLPWDEFDLIIKKHKDYNKLINLLVPFDEKLKNLKKYDFEKAKGELPRFAWGKGFEVNWNRLNPAWKYAIAFEKYLSNDLERIKKNKPEYSQLSNISKEKVTDVKPDSVDLDYLPGLKKEYEIAYLWASWDAKNMMIKFDPTEKKLNPYADIYAKNQELSVKIFWSNISGFTKSSNKKEATFKCAPPDWVEIWQWPQAIQCRIKNMLPPKIEISDWHCSASSINFWNLSENAIENSFTQNSENQTCSLDLNKDWISDCLEKVDKLVLSSDANTYWYNSFVSLKASFYEWDKKATFVNNTPVSFEIYRVEKAKDETKDLSTNNMEVVYDIDENLKDVTVLNDLLNFPKNIWTPTTFWEVNYWFTTKNKDLNIYIRAKSKTASTLENWASKDLDAKTIKIEVRSNSLWTSAYIYSKEKNIFEDNLYTLKANDKVNVLINDIWSRNIENLKENLSKTVKSEQSLLVTLNNFSRWGKIQDVKYPINVKLLNKGKILQDLDIKNRQEFIEMSALSTSGTYVLKITDARKLSTEREFTVVANDVKSAKIDLGSNLLLANWSVSSNILTIYDQFGNPILWQNYKANLKISGNKFVLLDNAEWDKDNINLNLYYWYRAFRLKSLENFWESTLTAEIIDTNTNKVVVTNSTKISSVKNAKILLQKPEISVWWNSYKLQASIVDENNNFIPWVNSRLYFTWDNTYFSTTKPYFEIKDSKWEIEIQTNTLASENVPVELQMEWVSKIFNEKISIKPDLPVKVDILVENPKLEITKSTNVYFELKDRYNNTVKPDSNIKLNVENSWDALSSISQPVLENWVLKSKAVASNLPWTWYFKVSVPQISENNFTINEDGKELKVQAVSENAWKIDTFYFWNKEKIQKQNYNSLYSVLLGSNYWDIEQSDYLAWNLLFDKDSRALAVTSLLETGTKSNNILEVLKNWNVKFAYSSSDLTQNITSNIWFDNWKLYLNIFNKALNINIWQIFYNIKNSSLNVCKTKEWCFDTKKNFITWISNSENYNFYKTWDKLSFKDNFGENIFSVSENGIFERLSDVTFEINSENFDSFLDLKIFRANQYVWNLYINFANSEVSISRDSNIFERKRNLDNSGVLLNINTNFYWNSKKSNWVALFYIDPFATTSWLDTFSSSSYSWFENFPKMDWVGWKWDNKSLLSFAAGKTVWESVKDYMSFYTINLWDPFIKLKTERKKFNWANVNKQFDSTIWKILAKDDSIIDYKVFDYNNDWRDDILLRKYNNYLELLENKNTKWNYLSLWNIAQIYDLGSYLEVWDFTWDWFDDIFFVWKDWKPYLLNNISKDFTRVDLSTKIDLKWKISEVSVFDMDNDWKSDITILDESWELNIFYWWWVSANPTFTKNRISEGYAVSLSSWSRKNGSIINYLWLKEPEIKIQSRKAEEIDNATVNSEIFVRLPLDASDTKQDSNNLDDLNWVSTNTSFLKSEYFSSIWLSYDKKYKDRNWWKLIAWDVVDVEITIKNTSWKSFYKTNFFEQFEKYFNIDYKTIKNSKWIEIFAWIWNYNFGLKDFTLSAWETLTINYSWTVKKLSAFTLKTWLFEKWESWDDLYWDVILDDGNPRCWQPLAFFRSQTARTYAKSKVSETCDVSELPKDFQKNSKDSNKNWIPDYIEDLKDKPEDRQKFANEQLTALNSDKDWDWIPDDSDYYSWDNQKISTIDKISEWLDKAQDLLDGLSCGFSNGACIATPLNWAPLAPGSDPTFMWKPIWDWLNIDEWIPIFSALTWMQYWPYWWPSVWPISPLGYNTRTNNAWWMLWIDDQSNFFRLFVTPTLTGWVWTAICFWGSPRIAWNSIIKWLAPLFPGWNCIVVAKPLLSCSNDGSEWDPSSVWIPDNSKNYSIINAWQGKNQTCEINKWTWKISENYVKQYLNNNKNSRTVWAFKTAVENHSEYDWSALFNLFTSEDWEEWIFVWLAPKSEESTDFSDIEEIVMDRIESFPAFFMNWATRQIEEIISKLLDFPNLFLILPDFGWIYDSELSWNQNWENFKNRANKKWQDLAKNLDTISTDRSRSFALLSNSEATRKINDWVKKVNSWIKQAYEFIWTLPLVNLEQDNVKITVPWLSDEEFQRTKTSWENTLKQWESERQRFMTKQWLNDEFKDKVNLQVSWLIWSIKKNLKVLDEYRQVPEKVKELINKKEDYLEQVICNIEIVSEVTWGWIWKNGDRFKAWVELIILIKAILKSWQAFVDIFIDYENSCRECKNERHDLVDYEFQLINMIVPKIPIVKFPKWPDIIVDLHNIRASLDVTIPEFDITTKSVNLPHLPNLTLPEVPDVNWWLNLPEIPILPEINIPELPDLPTLPSVKLPDLPPPPKLPKLFAGFEFIIDFAKLITKAMCILKSSPFHPEWRAWDQIAFLTERNGYLWIDFLNKSLPQFELPFVSAIKVTSYVNMEYSTDFITEFAKEAVKPINSQTTDFTNVFNLSVWDVDLRELAPTSIDIEAWKQANSKGLDLKNLIAKTLNSKVTEFSEKAKTEKDLTLTNKEFKEEIFKFLNKEEIVWDPAFDGLRKIWNEAQSYDFSAENELIKNLEKYNFEKFETLKNIISTEKQKNRNLGKELQETLSSWILKVSEKNSSIDLYREKMDKFNFKTFENIWKIVEQKENNSDKHELKNIWNEVLNQSKNVLKSYSDKSKNLLATNSRLWVWTEQTSWTCSVWHSVNSGDYSYNYTWIYVLENWKSYRLFDYIDEVTWKEQTTSTDFDKDWDEDLLYFVNNTLYLKENFDKESQKNYTYSAPIVLDSSDNKFLKNNFIESVNNAVESDISNSIINISFSELQNINNYRLSYFDIVDKSFNLEREENSSRKNKHVVDWIANSDNITLIDENNFYIKRKDIASIFRVWNFRWLEMKTKKLKSIKEDLKTWKTVTLSSWARLYSWLSILDINYKFNDSDEIFKLRLEPNTNIEAKQDIIITWVTNWDWYVNTWEDIVLTWDDISKMWWQPLLFETEITFIGNKSDLGIDSYIDLKYYDNSDFRIDFNKIYSWELYDLWLKSDSYLFSVNKPNDYYYAKINAFKNNVLWTSTEQLLLSPQLKADKNKPDISLNSIKIPIYQELNIDITGNITEDSWIDWLQKIFIDFDLDVDSNWDLNTKNDDDSSPVLNIFKKDWKIFLKAWKFTTLQKKKIWVNIVDENWNIWYKEVDFEVYSPIPEIQSYDWVTISWKISEELSNEPISFYRFRAWNLSKLWDEKENILVYTNDKWEFSLNSWTFRWGLTIKDTSWKEIASVSEKTWKISIDSKNLARYNITASLKESTNYPEIFINDKVSTKNIFSEVLSVKWNSKVSQVENFENLDKNGIYIKNYNTNENINYYILPDNIVNNPWVFVWYMKNDANQNPIIKIYPDWRIDLPKNYKINYSTYKDYVVLKIFDNSWKIIFDVLFKMDADYIIN